MDWLVNAMLSVFISIIEWILEFVREPAVNGIKHWMTYIFDSMGSGLGDIQSLLGDTPETYNATIYDIVRSTSEAAILPIAMGILVIISVHELAMNFANTSNMREFDVSSIIKWLLKFLFSLFILSHTFHITEFIFSIGPIISDYMLGSGGIISDVTDTTEIINGIGELVDTMSIWEVLGLLITSVVMAFVMFIMQIILTTFMLFRIMEIYLTLSLAPIPMATFGSKEYSRIGEGYIKTLLSYSLQIFLIILCIAIYTGMVNVTLNNMISSATYDSMAVVQMLAIMAIMVMMITKTKNLAREILG